MHGFRSLIMSINLTHLILTMRLSKDANEILSRSCLNISFFFGSIKWPITRLNVVRHGLGSINPSLTTKAPFPPPSLFRLNEARMSLVPLPHGPHCL